MYNANDPLKIGQRIAKNRITMAPTVKFMAGDDGMVTEDFVKHYEERAKDECGFICVEATCVSKEGRLFPSQLGLWCDEQIEGHKKIVDACHKYGALVVPQIHHGGLGTHPDCGPMTSPTRIEWNNGKDKAWAVELTNADIKRIVQEFIMAAVRAKKAGYDGVQLHACHGYLINNFTSRVNKRTDEYGGSNENKARFGCEIIRGIKEECGEDFIVSARVSGYDPTFEDAVDYADAYVKAGCDFLQVSCGVELLDEIIPLHDDSLPYNFIAELGVKMHEKFKGVVPVSLVNGINSPEVANYLFEHELVDAVDLGRGLLADPMLTKAILNGDDYHKCYDCKACGFGPGHIHICPAMKARGVSEFGW